MILSNNDYAVARKEFISSISVLDNVESIYETGTLSTPGLSDLDFLIIIKDLWSINDTANYYSIRAEHSSLLKELIGDGTVLVVPSGLHQHINIIDNFNINVLYGDTDDDVNIKAFSDKYDEIMRILDWLPERVVKLCQLAPDSVIDIQYIKNYELNIHGVLKSLHTSLKKLNGLLSDSDYTKRYDDLSDQLLMLRSEWFGISNSQQIDGLCSIIMKSISFGLESLNIFSSYLKMSNILSVNAASGDANQFKCFNLKTSETFNVCGEMITTAIPDVYFLNYALQSMLDNDLSNLIQNELIIDNKLLQNDDYVVDSELLDTLDKRCLFVNENLKFLKKRDFVDGLLKYGMFI